MPYLVREHLYIGNIGDAVEVFQNGSNGITHILSLLSSESILFFSEWRSEISIPCKEIRKAYVKGSESEDILVNTSKSSLSPENLLFSLENVGKDFKFVRMAVPLRDMENEVLLDHLSVCLDFIEEGRKQGSVLVHCFAGVSRSAAITIAYLMKSEHLSLEDALKSLRQSSETACPNDGFLEQLKMFQQMGYKVDHTSPVYKQFRLKVLGESYNRGEKIDPSRFGPDPGVPAVMIPNKKAPSSPVYRCKKCRRLVALQENVMDHAPGGGETSFEWHKRRSRNPYNRPLETECSSAFIEPLQWMTAVVEGALEGKLSCVHCEARLGYFNWSGIQCSCGSWVTPAFQIHKSRVDISTV